MQYWINRNGVQTGPVSREELEKMNVGSDTYVWRSGLADWVKIGDVPELAELIAGRKRTAAVPPELPQQDDSGMADEAGCGDGQDAAERDTEMQAVPELPASQQPQYAVGQHDGENVPECPPTNLVWAVVSIVLCCVPVGIAALVLSLKVTSCYRAGEYAKAERMSEWSAWLCIVSIILGLVWSPISVLVALI